ncbi:hypothetical protein [Acaryochloris marina]|uniref:hypothetical protein n=1 Tax=Acaryochloris marina TaxID=155978 RepID=UPI001EE68C0E|nr:hypothetical protein [Acaryochloris marina]
MNTLLRLREWVIPGTISLLLLIGCSSKTTQLESSGDAEMDQTAAFSLSIIEKLEDRPTLETPSEIVNYMTSTAGTAELTPPSEEYEPDAASQYKGPRPAQTVWVQSAQQPRNDFFQKHLILSADDSAGVIVANAYRKDGNEPFFTWKWPVND